MAALLKFRMWELAMPDYYLSYLSNIGIIKNANLLTLIETLSKPQTIAQVADVIIYHGYLAQLKFYNCGYYPLRMSDTGARIVEIGKLVVNPELIGQST